MYTPAIVVVEKLNGQPYAVVTFTRDTEVVYERLPFNDTNELNSKIKSKTEELSNLQTESQKVTIGVYTIKPEVTKEITPLEIAIQNLYKLKEKINLGVLKETDPEFVDAIEIYNQANSIK